MADLHSAGHRRGVVCAPHAAAVEAGRAILAEGGNAVEAMVAMAATIAAVYPHMNHLGGDGFWLIREPSGRVRAIMAPGPAGRNARPGALSRARNHPAARAARRAHRAGRDRRLDAGAASGEGQRRQAAARCAADQRLRPRPRRLSGLAQPKPTHGKPSGRAQGCSGLCQNVPGRRQGAGGRHHAEAAGPRRDTRPARPCRPRRFLSRRYRPRDRSRSRPHRQPGHARGFEPLRGQDRRAAARRSLLRHGLQHRRADPGHRLVDDPRAVRPLGRDRGRKF